MGFRKTYFYWFQNKLDQKIFYYDHQYYTKVYIFCELEDKYNAKLMSF